MGLLYAFNVVGFRSTRVSYTVKHVVRCTSNKQGMNLVSL